MYFANMLVDVENISQQKKNGGCHGFNEILANNSTFNNLYAVAGFIPARRRAGK